MCPFQSANTNSVTELACEFIRACLLHCLEQVGIASTAVCAASTATNWFPGLTQEININSYHINLCMLLATYMVDNNRFVHRYIYKYF